MNTNIGRSGPGATQRRRSMARDAALGRLSRVTAALVTAAVGTVAAVALFVANALPGRSIVVTSGASTAGRQGQGSPVQGVTTPPNPSTTAAAPVAGPSALESTSQNAGSASPAPATPPTTLSPPPTVPRSTYRQPVIVSAVS